MNSNFNAEIPKEYLVCERCKQPNAVWDVGYCWECLDIILNEKFATSIKDGTFRTQLRIIQDFATLLEKTEEFTKENRSKLANMIQSLRV